MTTGELQELYFNNSVLLINDSRYNTQLRLICNQIARGEYFINYNILDDDKNSFYVEPQIFCTINKNMCGFPNFPIVDET